MIGHRTQPYRTGARMPGMALSMMQRGRAPGAPINAADFNRQRLAQSGLQALIQQRMAPRASADVRGQFRPQQPLGHAQGQDALQQLLLAALLGPARVR